MIEKLDEVTSEIAKLEEEKQAIIEEELAKAPPPPADRNIGEQTALDFLLKQSAQTIKIVINPIIRMEIPLEQMQVIGMEHDNLVTP